MIERVEGDSKRVVPMEGGHNFRDVGGYQTQGGARVRWGRVFRSGSMAELTPSDQDRFRQLGIRVVCDFRSNLERSTRPSRLPEPEMVDLWARDHESSVGDLLKALANPGTTAAAVRALMVAAYRHLPYEQADSYRELFQRIAAGRLPLVFHCSAGKDRTGIAAAVLLTVLGVPRDTVISDYLLTERFFEQGCRLVTADPTSRSLLHVDPSIWEPMMRAERVYIEAMFETLEGSHGSVDNYVRDVLGIDAATQLDVRRQLID